MCLPQPQPVRPPDLRVLLSHTDPTWLFSTLLTCPVTQTIVQTGNAGETRGQPRPRPPEPEPTCQANPQVTRGH